MRPREIPLTQGEVAFVDPVDFRDAMKHKWRLSRHGVNLYAKSHTAPEKYLHRMIMKPPPGLTVDHISGNSLDCRRENMRIATRKQNNANKGPRSGKVWSRFIGVSKTPRLRRWFAQIHAGGKHRVLGYFDTEEEAARAYDAAAREAYGEFARLNFP